LVCALCPLGAIKYYNNPFKTGELFLKGWLKTAVITANRERIPVVPLYVNIQTDYQSGFLHEAHTTNKNDDLRSGSARPNATNHSTQFSTPPKVLFRHPEKFVTYIDSLILLQW
jgi:hypothetical protein